MRRGRISPALTLLLAVWAVPAAGQDQNAVEPPRTLSQFTLTALDGHPFASNQRLRGRAAVITFWRVDQEPSVRMLKDLKQLQDEFTKREVLLISIVAGTVERLRVEQVVNDLEITFPVLFDLDRRLYAELGVIVSPSTWFVDRNGIVLDNYPGHRQDFLRVARANLEFLRGDIDEAERVRRIRARPRPLDEEGKNLAGEQTRYQLALRLLEKGRRGAAVKQLTRAWESERPLVDAGLRLGLLLLEDGRDAEALVILERATSLAPADPLAIGAHGVALIRMGQERTGAEKLRQALQHPVADPLLYYEMARLSERSNAPDEARRYYRMGLELMLDNRAARRGD